MSTFWTVRTRYGAFFIIPSGGRFEVRFEDEPLGSYHSLASALDNLLSGQVDWPSTGLDPSKADLPDEIGQWTSSGDDRLSVTLVMAAGTARSSKPLALWPVCGPVTAKVCVLATALRNTQFVKSAAPDPQHNQALRPFFPRAPDGEVSRDPIDVRSTVRPQQRASCS